MLLSRRNQLLLEFSFWNEPIPRPGPNVYELRSYQLRVNLHHHTNYMHVCFSLSTFDGQTTWFNTPLSSSNSRSSQGR